MNYMLDACAFLALLNKESGMVAVKDLLVQAHEDKAMVYMSIVNFTEVYYDRLKKEKPDITEAFLECVKLLPITIIETVSRNISLEAGRIKVSYKMSLADAFLLGTASCYSATVVTSDYGELEKIENQEPIPFLWIRPKPEPKQGKEKTPSMGQADLNSVIKRAEQAERMLAEANRRIAELEARICP